MIEERNLARLKAMFLVARDVDGDTAYPLSTLIDATEYFVTNKDVFDGLTGALQAAHAEDDEIELGTWFELLEEYTMPDQNQQVVLVEDDGRDLFEGNRG